MKFFNYTLPTRAALAAGSFALLTLVGCQQQTSSEYKGSLTATSDKMGKQIEERFAYHISQYHQLPEVESAELHDIEIALNGTTRNEVQKLLAQLPNNPKDKNNPKGNNKAPESTATDSSNIAKTDSMPKVDNPIVQNAALLLGVRSYDEGYQTIQGISKRFAAQIISEEERSSDSLLENTFVLLTPPENFEAVIGELREMAMIIRQKRIWRKDLTAQFIDLKTRITTKQEAQMRLNGLLANSKDPAEVLPVQRELDEINTELESLVRTTRALSEKAVFTTITVTIYQTLERPVAQADFGDRFSGGLTKGWVDFKDFLINATLVWPWVVIGFLFLLTFWLAVRTSRRQSRQSQLQAMQAQQQWLIQQQKFTAPNQQQQQPQPKK